MADKDRNQHNKLQMEYFQQRADIFEAPIPEDIQKRTAYIVETAGVGAETKILDVGTGAGVLIRHFLDAGACQENIVGCDLTERMLTLASGHYPRVFFWRGDVMELSLTSPPPNFPRHISSFDRVFFNACFANMHDRLAVLKHSAELLSPAGGKIVISHPLPQVVVGLHKSTPELVPHLLPTQEEAREWCGLTGLRLLHFESKELIYLSIFGRP